ncbi:MAG: hypothetical protein WC869_01925 [Phycisphaerae bacterium]|jgi:hypothetical protein
MSIPAHNVWSTLAESYTALERWQNRDWPTGARNALPEWWTYVAIGILIALATVLGVMVLARKVKESGSAKGFTGHCRAAGLDGAEQGLLKLLAKLARLKHPEAIFDDEEALERGVEALVATERVIAMSPEAQKRMAGLIESIRLKLGFASLTAAREGVTTSRQVVEGGQVTINHGASGFAAIVVQNNLTGLVVELKSPVEVAIGEKWRVRYAWGCSVWEFDTAVTWSNDGKVGLGHTNQIRLINRRRFPRVRTSKPAFIAAFPIVRDNASVDVPEFLPARLTEIAGPGLEIEANPPVKAGDTVLVVLRFDQRVLQGLARVIRVRAAQNGPGAVVVEMSGLNAAADAELANETYKAQIEAKQAGAGPQFRAGETAPEPVEAPAEETSHV